MTLELMRFQPLTATLAMSRFSISDLQKNSKRMSASPALLAAIWCGTLAPGRMVVDVTREDRRCAQDVE